MKINFIIPWNNEKNIGVSYNNSMEMIDDNDWVCFTDGDVMHLNAFFGTNINKVILENPEYDLFTCYTNRISCSWQKLPNVDLDNNNINYHKKIAEDQWNKFKTKCTDVTHYSLLSGMMILISKATWKKFGKFDEKGMLHVDQKYHKKIKENGGKIGRADGIYVYHWYRNNNYKNKRHLYSIKHS